MRVERIIHRLAFINLDDCFHRIHPFPFFEFVHVLSGRAGDVEIEIAREGSTVARRQRTVRSEFEPHHDIALDRIRRHDPAADIDAVLSRLCGISRELGRAIVTFVFVSAENENIKAGENEEQNNDDNERLL